MRGNGYQKASACAEMRPPNACSKAPTSAMRGLFLGSMMMWTIMDLTRSGQGRCATALDGSFMIFTAPKNLISARQGVIQQAPDRADLGLMSHEWICRKGKAQDT